MALIFIFKILLLLRVSPLSLQPEILGYWIAKESSYKFGYFLKRFDKGPPVGNASKVYN